MQNTLIFICFLISFAACGQNQPKQEVVKEVKEIAKPLFPQLSPGQCFANGMQFYNNGYYAKAIIAFQQTIKRDSKYLKAYNYLGLSYDEQGNYKEAVEAFTSALKINPNFVDALTNRGRQYAILGKYKEALMDFTNVIKINPRLEIAYYGRARTYYDLGQYKKALKDYEYCIKLEPSDGSAYHDTGVVKRALKDFQGACEAWKQGIAIGSESSQRKYNQFCKE